MGYNKLRVRCVCGCVCVEECVCVGDRERGEVGCVCGACGRVKCGVYMQCVIEMHTFNLQRPLSPGKMSLPGGSIVRS